MDPERLVGGPGTTKAPDEPRPAAIPLATALWNPRVGAELRKLTEAKQQALSTSAARPKGRASTKRPGWATKLALAALTEAAEPMPFAHLRRRILQMTGEPIDHSTLSYALRKSKAAREGRIAQATNGLWYAPTSAT